MSDQHETASNSREPRTLGHPRFVTRAEFVVMSKSAPDISPAAFRADQDAVGEG
jgi:hypothetical protein